MTLAAVVPAAGAYPLPGALADGHDYSAYCPVRPQDSGTSGATGAVGPTGDAGVYIAQENADGCVRREQLSVAQSEVLHGDLWFLGGLVAGSFVGHWVLRTVMP